MKGKVDDPFRFMSTVIDWRRVMTGVVVGVPCAASMYVSAHRILEFRVDSLQQELREGDQRVLTTLQREIDALRADVRELRADRKAKP